MPDDHSESVPPLPIPNRTVKRLHADDSADSRVKVGNRQAPQQHQKPHPEKVGFLRLRPPVVARRPPASGKRPAGADEHEQTQTNTWKTARNIRAKLSTRTRAFTPCPAAPPSHSPSVPDTPVPPPHLRDSPAPHFLSTSRLLNAGKRFGGVSPPSQLTRDRSKPVCVLAPDTACPR